jgi:hypothetical protein
MTLEHFSQCFLPIILFRQLPGRTEHFSKLQIIFRVVQKIVIVKLGACNLILAVEPYQTPKFKKSRNEFQRRA